MEDTPRHIPLMPWITKDCPICGRQFAVRRTRIIQKTCSHRCGGLLKWKKIYDPKPI